MFDVTLDGGESYRESAAYRPGERAVVAEAAGVRLGLSVCYDLRFPHLYRDLAKAGAEVLTVPVGLHGADGTRALARAAARPGDRDRLLRARPGAVRAPMPPPPARRAGPSATASRSRPGAR